MLTTENTFTEYPDIVSFDQMRERRDNNDQL